MKLYPLTQTQLGIYLSETTASGNADYNIDLLYYLDNEVDISRLKYALELTINGHPYLKAQLVQSDDGSLFLEDHSTDAPIVSIEEVTSREEMMRSVGRPFDLLNAPLYRFIIFSLPDDSHILYMDFHHILCDGMSCTTFHQEVGGIYDALSEGLAIDVESESYAFSQAEQEENLRRSAAYQDARQWYQNEFAQAAEIDSMPLPQPEISSAENNPHWVTEFLSVTVTENEISKCCEKFGVGPSIPFTAAFGYTLANYTASAPVLFTTIWHGREGQEYFDKMGMMVKTLPVFVDFAKTTEIADLFQTVKRQLKEARRHSIYSFADFTRELEVHPRICFAYHANLHMYHLVLNGREQKDDFIRHHRPGLDWILNLIRLENGTYQCKIEYDSNSYSSEFVHQFCITYSNILRGMLSQKSVGDIELVNTEQLSVLNSFNEPYIKENNEQDTILSLFKKSVEVFPDNTAIIFNDILLTYKQLDIQSDKLARTILKVLPQSDSQPVVAILIHRSEMMAVCALAAMKVGAAYQPLDPSYPQERLNFMVQDSNAQILLCDKDLRSLITDFSGEVLFVDSVEQLPDEKEIQLPRSLQPDDTFILLYTSGSTGTPKGVILQHHNLVTFCGWYQRYYDLKPEHRVLAYASFGFDANMMDLYPALTTGAAVVVIPEELRLDLNAFCDYTIKHHVTHGFITTQVGYQVATMFPEHPTFQHLSIGGEKLASIVPPKTFQLYNAYGPTECTIFSTIFPVIHNELNIPIGRTLDTMCGFVVNNYGKRLPWGAAGELILAGDQIGHGYLHRPDLNDTVFFEWDGQRAYHSGDIVRYRENGDIEFVGRRDGQVKIRGFRIELKEVEAVIRNFDGIRDCTVQAFEQEGAGKFIAAYVVSEQPVDIEALNTFIASQKPAYMVPAVTMQLDSIPLNVNQKVDKKKLPKPEIQSSSLASDEPHVFNVLEQRLVDLVTELTQQPVTLTDPLVYLGLTSITAMRLSVMIFKQFGLKMSSQDLLGKATVLSIENAILEILMAYNGKNENKTVQATEDAQEAPLTFAQQGVYTDCLKNNDSTIYNIPMAIRLPLSVGMEKLIQAATKVLETHPMLFAHFYENEEGDVMQSCQAERKASVAKTETSEEGLIDVMRQFVKPFDLKKDLLHRAMVVKTEAYLHLLLDIHHLVSDGDSYDVLLKELVAVLKGEKLTGENRSYLSFALEQKNLEQRGELEPHRLFFADLLAEMEETTSIPSDLSGKKEGFVAEVVHSIPQLSISHDNDVTDASFWFAATAYTVARFSNLRDVYMLMVSNGRRDPEIVDTIGMFVNTLPATAHLREQSVSEYLEQTAKDFRATIEHETYPFSRIAAEFDYKPEIVFAYQLGVIDKHQIDGQAVDIHSFGIEIPKFKLGIFIEMHEDVPSLVLQYNDACYSQEMMNQLSECILAVAARMAAHPQQPVRSLSIMTEQQRKQVTDFSHLADAKIEVETFHAGIERWSDKTPEATAIVASDRTLTYREYDSAANALAHALIEKGVRRGDRVVLLLPRTSDFLVSVFAVMKCGAAFIPMDPQYPADRIAYILEDSNGKFVITTNEHLSKYADRALDIEELKKQSVNTQKVEVPVSAEDLAYLIYTSGSTGKPKGVMLQHKGICNYLTPHPANPHTYAVANEAKAVLCSATVSFDLSILEYGTALFNGKTVVFADEEACTDSARLAKLYEETGADVLSGTPSRIEVYMEMPEYRKVVAACKVVQMGGEKLSMSLMNRLQKMTKAKIFNMYGPTEITICCNADLINHSKEVTVGRPLQNFTEYIIDPDGNELPIGVMGELMISGVGVCPGYNNLPEKTNEAFVEWQGKRCYKTGDYARWTEDGKVVIMGRTDSQIKLNGLRIELGEIETVMEQQPGVKQCVVLVKKVGTQDKLVAYYVGDNNSKNIKKGMAEHLTHYMVPSVFVNLNAFPMTPAGKIDMRHLPEPTINSETEYVAPETETERDFCDIFAQILQLERVGTTDDFFALGGTSLVAIKVVIAAGKKGYELTYSDVFAHPTPQALAKLQLSHNIKEDNCSSPEYVSDEHHTDKFDNLLKQNTLNSFLSGESLPLGNVMLTGATGFLGIHVLYHLLTKTDAKIYCPIRRKYDLLSEVRLQSLLFYYFGKTFEELLNQRLFVLEGEVTQNEWLTKVDVPADTVINCLANVKHFSNTNDITYANVESVRNLIQWCCHKKARLVHISTTSVAGKSMNGTPGFTHQFTEQEYNIGQYIDNQYVKSKFMAEGLVLDAIMHHGLIGKILRVGNLSARSSDGEFQVNFNNNNFVALIRAYQTLGACPYALLDVPCEFSPINEVAEAVVLLATTPKSCIIFHPTNSHRQLMGDVLHELHLVGTKVRPVEQEEFTTLMNNALTDETVALRLRPLMAYANETEKIARSISSANFYTTQILHRLGFHWSITTWDYVDKFLKQLNELGYFD